MNTKKIVSANIKYWMCFHEMTNKELSEALEKRGFKICPSQLSKRLQGVIDFSVQEIFAVAEILKVDAPELLATREVNMEYSKLRRRLDRLEKKLEGRL